MPSLSGMIHCSLAIKLKEFLAFYPNLKIYAADTVTCLTWQLSKRRGHGDTHPEKIGKGIILMIGFSPVLCHLDSAIQRAICYEHYPTVQNEGTGTVT